MSHEIQNILDARELHYGDYTSQSKISQELKSVIRKYDGMLTHYQRESLDMIANKVGRILNGNPNFKDSWDDIAGYAKLSADRCPGPANVVENFRVPLGGCVTVKSGTPEDGGQHARFSYSHDDDMPLTVQRS